MKNMSLVTCHLLKKIPLLNLHMTNDKGQRTKDKGQVIQN